VSASAPLSVVVPSTSTLNEPITGMTAIGSPNISVRPVNPLVLVLVRTVRTFLQTWLGLLIGAGVGTVAIGTLGSPPDGLMQAITLRDTIAATALASAGPALISLIQNSIEYLARFDRSHPELRA